MPDSTEDFISSQEALRILRVALCTLTRWAADGKITPAYKMPGSNGAFLWRRTDVVKLAEERTAAQAVTSTEPAAVTP